MIGRNKECPHDGGICNIVRMHGVAAENNLQAAARVVIPDSPDVPTVQAEESADADVYFVRAEHHQTAYINNIAKLPEVADRCGSCLVGQVTAIHNSWGNII